MTTIPEPPEVTAPEVTEPEVTAPEVTEPEVTEPEVTAPEVTAPARPTVATAPPHRSPPRARGAALVTAAVAVGAVGLGFKVAGTVQGVRTSRYAWCDDGSCGSYWVHRRSVIGSPLLLASAGLLGGAMALRGRLRAHDDLFHDVRNYQTRDVRWPRRGVLGWSLFGGGLALWAVSRLVFAAACGSDDECLVIGWEATYYASAGMVFTGMMLGPYATAHRRYQARVGPHPTTRTVAPMLSRDFAGAAISGRF